MPQIRICPTCNKVLQTGETHKCSHMASEYATCEKCGEKYLKSRPHMCTTRI
ncbi:MAG: hypothetical protein KGI02_03800 [Thaumarchaeota archaeon]|nr:hypothetical protein [Nitrososphaerota archaeon]MDE1840258.1 hypothetical protein [Nitrososphaerota archaeon]MDE1877679.1 hypothetical protein [Nitrososphaerota archaeon]